jgi:hypothetical protein
MERVAAVYLAHLNPLTIAHTNIISFLLSKNYNVYIYPVRFLKNDKEINTRSFPFPYEIRKAMIESAFGRNASISVSPDYSLESPFIRYIPPLISPFSWSLRNQILRNVREKEFVSYTGDIAERITLNFFRLKPLKARRQAGSASDVKELLYKQAITEFEGSRSELKHIENSWQEKVPNGVVDLIERHWDIIKDYSKSTDHTLRVLGMKIPKEGFI